MGLISSLYVAFASIALFACVHQLIISYKWKGEIVFLVAAWLSLTAFIGFIYLSLCLSPWGITCPPFAMLRTELFLGQLVVISMIWLIFYLLNVPRLIYIIPGSVIFLVLMILTIVLPDHLLFSEDASYRKVSIFFDNLIRLNSEFTFWRVIINLSVLILIVHVILFLIKQSKIINSGINTAIVTGLTLALLAGFFDQLVDLGHVNSSLLLPTAIFIFYAILIVLVFYQFINKLSEQKLIRDAEKVWQNLISQSNLAIVKLNRMGNVQYINPYFYKLTGFNENEVLGKDWFETFIPPKDYYNLQGAFVDALNSEFQPQYVNSILDKNKKELIIRWFNVKMVDSEGGITGSLSIGINITEDIKHIEETEKKLKAAEELITLLQSRQSPTHNPG